MEVVAAVSGIAGIISLAGQILTGIVKLQGIFTNFNDASRTIAKFISALKSLLDTIQDVKELVLKLERASTFIAKSILSSLQIQLEDCSHDVCQWVKVASSSQSKSGKGSFDDVKRRFLVALKKESFDGIFREIASHKDNISIKLSVIGRHLNIQHTSHLRSIESKIVEVHSKSTANHQITADALQRLESQLAGGPQGSPCPSLKSLADQMSDIQSLLRSQSSVGSVRSGGGSRKTSAIFSGHISPRRPSVTSNASSVGSKRTSQYGKSSNLPVRRKSSLSLGQIDTQITPRLPRYQDPSSPIAEHPGVPTLSIHSDYASTQGSYRRVAPPIDGVQSSKKLLDAAKSFCPSSLLAYMEIIRISETISLHTKLLTCIRKFQGADSLDLMDTKEYQDVQIKLESLRLELAQARQLCWLEGLDMEDIDKVLSSGYGQDLPKLDEPEMEEQNEDLTILSRRLQRLQGEPAWTSKLDRVNAWLLQTLAASEEATALHRSYVQNSDLLDERQWARLVLKYWLIDDAAMSAKIRSPSTIGAMMDGKCHSIKVRLDMPQKDWESLADTVSENEKCFDICSESGWKRGTLYKQQVTITVTEVTATFG